MAKQDRGLSFADDTQPFFVDKRLHFFQWVSDAAPTLSNSTGHVPDRVRETARKIVSKSRGVVVSSTIALSAAIMALKGSSDFGDESIELSLLKAVLRYSEQYQVPPMMVMSLFLDDDDYNRYD